MEKFSPEQNKEHWEQFAKKHKNSQTGASYDSNLVELENFFIVSLLKKIKPKTVLDIGCGNGQRTKLFSHYISNKIIGIDYSKSMIKQAKELENKKISFELNDIWNYTSLNKFDIIISCRCFINQNSYYQQVKLFKKLHKMLKPKGHLIIAEASVEGLCNLNKLRKEFSLKPIEEHWFNVHIKEKHVFPKIKTIFKFNQVRRLGLFYYLARVVHSAAVYPKEANRISKINDIAKKSQIIFFNSDIFFEKFGRHLLIDFQKK